MAGLLALGACDRETPTDVGSEQVPASELRTYEVLLEGSDFLLADTLVRGFGTSTLSPILFVAEDWRDTLDAHAFVRFAEFPTTVVRVDSGATVTDTILRYIEGRIVVRVDTAGLGLDTLGTDTTIAFEMYQVGESFDPRTVSWTARSVIEGDTTFWATPGGTPGALIGTGSWTRSDTAAADSMVFTLDSAAVNALANVAEDDARAVMMVTTTPGARAQLAVPRLQLTTRLVEEPDTTHSVSSVVTAQAYVYDPPPPEPVDELRLGDRSAWRTFLMFRPGLDTLSIPCPEDPLNCSFRLGDVAVNRAELRLTAMEVPSVYRPRANISVEARPVLGEPERPLERAPLADTTGIARGIQPEDFAGEDSVISIAISRFVRGLLDAGTDSTVTERNRTLALLTEPEPISFGIARFFPLGAPTRQPVLRLIVTVAPREEDE